MRITSGGQVLVGSTSSLYADTNRGVFEVNGSSSSILGLKIGDTNGGYILHTGTDLAIWNAKNGSQTFATNNTERMRLTSGGELLINTTSDAGDYKLQVNGNGRFAGDIITSNGNIGVYNSNVQVQFIDVANSNYTYSLQNYSSQFRLYNNNTSTTVLNFTSGSNAEFAGSIKTAAPSGGTAKPWKLGEAGVTLGGSNTSGVRVEIDGTVYYLVTGYLP